MGRWGDRLKTTLLEQFTLTGATNTELRILRRIECILENRSGR